jgi:two-component system, NtrC family, nitrogen regulation response regulator NtrX
MNSILVVDDEADIRKSLRGVLEDEGYKVATAESGEACLDILKTRSFDVVLLDIWLPGIDGLETLEKIKEHLDPPEAIIISGHGTIETAVKATKLGAFDFLEKPLSLERTLILIKNAMQARKLRGDNLEYRKQLESRSVIVGESVPTKALRQQIAVMAPTNGRVLIYGESGTGKELVARAIHNQSLRRENLFTEVNCAAIPEDFIEAELFGFRNSAGPGGASEKTGTFERADGGTLFLDEVGDMSLKTQSKVLRTLDEQRFTPVGAEEPITVDVRVIASTNKNLEVQIGDGNFREDLFYRLNVIPFYVPPLRDRLEDIPLLVRHFLKEFSSNYSRRTREVNDDALDVLMKYSWPGNVRELRNVIERAVIVARSGWIEPRHLPPYLQAFAPGAKPTLTLPAGTTLAEAERLLILQTLERVGNNKAEAARQLGLDVKTIRNKLRSYGRDE